MRSNIMRILIIVLAVVVKLGFCSLQQWSNHGVRIGIDEKSEIPHSLYHSQDKYGQYMYGYASALSSKDEVKTGDGVTRGGYSYIDANGYIQTVHYVSDPIFGFRVMATNIPRDLPEVAYARAQHLAAYEHIQAEHAAISAANNNNQQNNHITISPLPIAGGIVMPIRYYPTIASSSQYHAQDKYGHYSYGYSDPLSTKSETKSADGVTRGGYSYLDANGILQTIHYISDPVNGFQVAATNLPETPSVQLIGPKVTIEPDEIVQNTKIPIIFNHEKEQATILHTNPNQQQLPVTIGISHPSDIQNNNHQVNPPIFINSGLQQQQIRNQYHPFAAHENIEVTQNQQYLNPNNNNDESSTLGTIIVPPIDAQQSIVQLQEHSGLLNQPVEYSTIIHENNEKIIDSTIQQNISQLPQYYPIDQANNNNNNYHLTNSAHQPVPIYGKQQAEDIINDDQIRTNNANEQSEQHFYVRPVERQEEAATLQAAHNSAPKITGPTGYYTTNIQY